MVGCPGEVAVTVSTRSIYVKLTIYTVNHRIYRNTDTDTNPKPIPNPHILDLVDTVTATSAGQQ